MTDSLVELDICRACGRRTAAGQVLSRHNTADGVLAWARCPCGALQARFRPYGRPIERVVASGRPREDPRSQSDR